MPSDFGTTNTLLAVMAAVSVLEALLLIGLGIGGFLVYRRVMRLITDLEERQIAPLTAKVNAILADVQGITARVQAQAARVEHAITGTMERVDHTATRVKHTVRERVDRIVDVVHAVRATIASLFGRRVAG